MFEYHLNSFWPRGPILSKSFMYVQLLPNRKSWVDEMLLYFSDFIYGKFWPFQLTSIINHKEKKKEIWHQLLALSKIIICLFSTKKKIENSCPVKKVIKFPTPGCIWGSHELNQVYKKLFSPQLFLNPNPKMNIKFVKKYFD